MTDIEDQGPRWALDSELKNWIVSSAASARGVALGLVVFLLVVTAMAALAHAQATTAYTIFGTQTNESLGQVVGNAGDVNGDGSDDLLIRSGVYYSSLGEKVGVYSGSDGSLLYSLASSGPNAGFGCSFTTLGDIDADGFDDFAVAACYDDVVATNAGRVTIHSGATGSVILTLSGAGADDNFGESICSISDLDGDGLRDLVIGIPGSDGAGIDFGEVRIYSTASGTVISGTFGTGSSSFGARIGSAGDVDGDGLEDLALGQPYETVGPLQNAGRIRVVSGGSGALLYTASGTSTNEYFGYTFTRCGDRNGDGYPDLVVGEPGASSGPWNGQNGRLLAISGFDGSILDTVWGGNPGDQLGVSITTIADFSGDGLEDLVVGYRGSFSSNSSTGGLRVYSASNFAILADFLGDSYGDNMGGAVAGGDFNNDNLPDFAAGAVGDDNNGSSCGSVRVFSGQPRSSTQIGGGQPNSAAAELMVNEYWTGTAKGPFSSVVQSGEVFSLDFRGAANCLINLYWSPLLNPSGWLFPGFGSFDLGTGPTFTDVQVVFDGFAGGFPYYGTDNTGRFHQNFYIPIGWPTGPFVNIQALIQHEQPWFSWATITAAHQLVVQ